jgi:lipoic acid synthetase
VNRKYAKKPSWLKKRVPTGPNYQKVQTLLNGYALRTVCREARCPNCSECFHQGTATFLLLGDICTRNCHYCAVKQGWAHPPDREEPRRVADAVRELGLSFVVLTSVTRDDLPDGGAAHFHKTVSAIQARNPDVWVEVLIPDFQGSFQALERVLKSGPAVLNHNLETVPRLYPTVRPRADYDRSLRLLAKARTDSNGTVVKSGLMLGLGETDEEVVRVMEDLVGVGCHVLTLGQYLQPLSGKVPVARYLHPEEFEGLRERGLSLGFCEVVAGPFVRSSFQARRAFLKATGEAFNRETGPPPTG